MTVFPRKMIVPSVLIFGLLVALPRLAAAEDWLDQIAHFLGISKTPSQQRGEDRLETGDIFVATISGLSTRVTTDGDYRSPVFLPGDAGLLALKGDEVMRLPLSGAAAQKLQTVPHALKLLGVDASDADRVLVLFEAPDGSYKSGVLALKSGQITLLPHNSNSKAHQRMMSYLRGDDREYKGVTIYVKTESKARLDGQVEWTDVYVKQVDAAPVNISRCDGSDCGQPALSSDGERVAFVRATATR